MSGSAGLGGQGTDQIVLLQLITRIEKIYYSCYFIKHVETINRSVVDPFKMVLVIA